MRIFTNKIERIRILNTLEELKYYCNEKQPVGAIMLTGEWGCGKTYFIENELRKELEKTHVIIRISLFGLSSIESIKNEVQLNWLQSYIDEKSETKGLGEKGINTLQGLMNVVNEETKNKFGPVGFIINKLSSLDIVDFIKVAPTIGNKKVVLVFDDLERSILSTNDMLGCINDYCENLHIHTIVVANEEYVKKNEYKETNKSIKYETIKEKIIYKTLVFNPDYCSIIENIINNYECNSDGYKPFLLTCIPKINNIFIAFDSPAILKKEKVLTNRPHNLRSLKYALHDFERIYQILHTKYFKNIDEWLSSFICYSLCCKANLIDFNKKDNPYGDIFKQSIEQTLFPEEYDSNCITNGMKVYVQNGTWNLKMISKELDTIIENKEKSELELIKNYYLDLNEADLNKYFSELLERTYGGGLSLYDYVSFISTCKNLRINNLLPNEINWENVNKGIRLHCEKLIKVGDEQPNLVNRIDINDGYSEFEKSAYKIISDFLSERILEFEKNKQEYNGLIEKNPIDAIRKVENCFFVKFDMDMAIATAKGFIQNPNKRKRYIAENFENAWEDNFSNEKFEYQSSIESFKSLKEKIQAYSNQCEKENLKISKINTDNFIRILKSLIKTIQTKIDNEGEAI
jgi:hypothetical protein